MIVMGMFLPLSSWIAEKIGYKNTLIFIASGFGLFSLLSGLVTSDVELFTFMGIQGLFAAFFASVARLAYLKFSENMLLEGTQHHYLTIYINNGYRRSSFRWYFCFNLC